MSTGSVVLLLEQDQYSDGVLTITWTTYWIILDKGDYAKLQDECYDASADGLKVREKTIGDLAVSRYKLAQTTHQNLLPLHQPATLHQC